MEKIDNLDKKILEIISNNARIHFKDVAAECGVSRAAVHQRVQLGRRQKGRRPSADVCSGEGF